MTDASKSARAEAAAAYFRANAAQWGRIRSLYVDERVVEGDPPAPMTERYEAATDMLAALHHHNLPPTLPLAPHVDYPIPVFDVDAWLVEIGLKAKK